MERSGGGSRKPSAGFYGRKGPRSEGRSCSGNPDSEAGTLSSAHGPPPPPHAVPCEPGGRTRSGAASSRAGLTLRVGGAGTGPARGPGAGQGRALRPDAHARPRPRLPPPWLQPRPAEPGSPGGERGRAWGPRASPPEESAPRRYLPAAPRAPPSRPPRPRPAAPRAAATTGPRAAASRRPQPRPRGVRTGGRGAGGDPSREGEAPPPGGRTSLGPRGGCRGRSALR